MTGRATRPTPSATARSASARPGRSASTPSPRSPGTRAERAGGAATTTYSLGGRFSRSLSHLELHDVDRRAGAGREAQVVGAGAQARGAQVVDVAAGAAEGRVVAEVVVRVG